MNDLKLISLAIDAMQNSYNKYSNFAVGAALLCDDGSVYTGCNVENSAFSATVCAERTAFFKAISEGKRAFKKIAVVGGKNNDISKPCMPCGVCRQVMSEFCDKDFCIVTLKDGAPQSHTLWELLPYAFEDML